MSLPDTGDRKELKKKKKAILHRRDLILNDSPTFDESLMSYTFALFRFLLGYTTNTFDHVNAGSLLTKLYKFQKMSSNKYIILGSMFLGTRGVSTYLTMK